jgi:hypothetical protein
MLLLHCLPGEQVVVAALLLQLVQGVQEAAAAAAEVVLVAACCCCCCCSLQLLVALPVYASRAVVGKRARECECCETSKEVESETACAYMQAM